MDSCTLFEEDEVYVLNAGKGYKFGIVLENSEYVSSDDEDYHDKTDDRLQKGSIRVAWHPSGKETVVPENKVKLVNRSLMPGDVVRRDVPGQDTQCGFIMDMDVRTHLRILRTNKYIYNVDSKDLQPIQKFVSGQEVILDLWWGKVENVFTDIDLVFPDGARCRVDEGDIAGVFEDYSEKQRHGEFSMCLYYTGQEVRGAIDGLCDAKWLHSTPRYCHKVANKLGKTQYVNASIEKIEARSIEVHWVFGGSNGKEGVTTPPPRIITGDDLKRIKILDWFASCSLQIADRRLYHIKNDDKIWTTEPGKVFIPQFSSDKTMNVQINPEFLKENKEVKETVEAENNKDEAAANVSDEYEDVSTDSDDSDAESEKATGRPNFRKKKNRGFKPGAARFKTNNRPTNKPVAKKPKKERVVKPDTLVEVESELTTSWAKVMWQDGSIELDIPSVKLFPVHHLDELEFFPGDFVLANHDLPLPEQPDYGVVTCAEHAERTCKVDWYKVYDAGKDAKESQPLLLEKDSEMSVYDLKDHPDYKFRPGLSVVPVGGLNDVQVSSHPSSDQPNDDIAKNSEESPPKESDNTSQKNKTLAEKRSLACQTVGQIFEVNSSGYLLVKWSDGSISKRYPQEVFMVSDEADEDSDNDEWDTESDYESNGSSEESWETESEHEVDFDDEIKEKESDSGCDRGNLKENKIEIDALLIRAETALNRLQKVINEFDGSIAVPDCFHDIICIYRSCHELDKILKTSFFSDPELQQLISQAKGELKKEKTNKISRHLTQLFETWSRSSPNAASNGRNFALVGVDGKTRTYGTPSKSSNLGEVSNDESLSKDNGDNENKNDEKQSSEKENDVEVLKNTDDEKPLKDCDVTASETSGATNDTNVESKVLKKEFSAPAISSLDIPETSLPRRPSDPIVEPSSASQQEVKNRVASLVGENCVAKASKRTKSEGFEDGGREAKKSREDCRNPNKEAQELCAKICKSLQKQILLISQDIDRRTSRLFSAIDKECDLHNDVKNKDLPDEEKPEATQSVIETNDETINSLVTSLGKNIPDDPSDTSVTSIQNTDVKANDSENDSLNRDIQKVDGEIQKDDGEIQKVNGDIQKVDGDIQKDDGDIQKDDGDIQKDDGDLSTNEADNDSPEVENESFSSPLSDFPVEDVKGFEMVSEAPESHAFFKKTSQPSNLRAFRNAIKKELKIFYTSLPDGIFVQGFENRMDLFSIMILGPEGTPYEDAVFLFDFMLPNDYPVSPPVCHYHSHCSDRLNPNLYEDGKVCVSLLGTWSGKGNEMWTTKSSLLQVLVSIQGLILVREPYYNEAGFERQRGTQVGEENSRVYNEMAILKTCESLTLMAKNIQHRKTFKNEIQTYLRNHGPRMIARLNQWLQTGLSKKTEVSIQKVEENTVSPSQVMCDTESVSGCKQVAGSQSTNPNILSESQSQNTGETLKQTDSVLSSASFDQGDVKTPEHSKSLLPELTKEEISNVSNSLQDLSLKPSPTNEDCPPNELNTSQVLNDTKLKSPASINASSPPEFPLFPISKGFCMTLRTHLRLYQNALEKLKEETCTTGSSL